MSSDSGAGRARTARNLVFWAAGAASLLVASWAAWRRAWVCDDAYISFRYAENLARGLGLVFNEGERVEGYSNFLWTMWTALGLSLGADPERWTIVAGIACYAAALGALVWHSWRTREGAAPWLPVAAVLGAVHFDWQLFATSGLETSLYTLEVTLLYVLLAPPDVGRPRALTAGLLCGVAAMTRPDGVVLAAAAGLFLLVTDPRRPRAPIALSAAFLAVWIPYTAWRMSYFGDYFPNTYYAKSAALAWYSQGAIYIALYFSKYWPLLLGPILVLLAWFRTPAGPGPHAPPSPDPWRRRAVLAAMLAAIYTGFVFHVGGDFMFARFLIPVTPLLLVLLEQGVRRMAAARARTEWIVTGVVAAGMILTPYPLPEDRFASVQGIVYEPHYYTRAATEHMRAQGLALRPYFEDLPVCVAFFGGEARLVYYARPRIAIECVTGLTDRTIARQPLAKRTRIGHEKLASVEYVLGERGAHLAFFRGARDVLRLDREIPLVDIDMGGVHGWVLTWDGALIDSLRRRGAAIQDFPTELDGLLAAPSPEHAMLEWFTYEKLRRFYFANVDDPGREALLRRRLREAGEAG